MSTGLAPGLERWLCDGGLAHEDGGIAAWRVAGTGELAYPYPEITGYFLTFAAATGASAGPVAGRAARWLVQRHRRGFAESRGTEPGVRYTFDTMVEAAGLLNHAGATGDEASLEVGQRLVRAGIRGILERRDIEPLQPGSRLPGRPPTWSTRGRLHLLKAIQPLCLGGGPAGLDAAGILVHRYATAVRLSSPHLTDERGRHLLHPYCYALEGLWVWSAVTGDPGAATAVADGLDAVGALALPSGASGRTVEDGEPQSDVTAQVARLATLVGRPEVAAPAIGYLRSVADALPGGRHAVRYREGEPRHHCSWASMFTAQAIRVHAEGRLDWRRLV